MARAKRIPRIKYYALWAKSGFPKREGKVKSFVIKKRKVTGVK